MCGSPTLHVCRCGRGERVLADTIQLSVRIEPQPVTNVPSYVHRASEIAQAALSRIRATIVMVPVGPDRWPFVAGYGSGTGAEDVMSARVCK